MYKAHANSRRPTPPGCPPLQPGDIHMAHAWASLSSRGNSPSSPASCIYHYYIYLIRMTNDADKLGGRKDVPVLISSPNGTVCFWSGFLAQLQRGFGGVQKSCTLFGRGPGGVISHFESCVLVARSERYTASVPLQRRCFLFGGRGKKAAMLVGRGGSRKPAVRWAANFPMLQETPVHVPHPPSEGILGNFNVY